MNLKITESLKNEVVSFYAKSPVTIQSVSDEFGLSNPTVIKILKSCGIKTWPKFNVYSPRFVEDYFATIDTEHKAYFLGLMITDGNVFVGYKSKTHPANVNLTLQSSDSYILEILKDELRLNKKVSNDGRGCCQLAVYSNAMAANLAEYGVIPRKSTIVTFPSHLIKNMYRHFIRGIFDGDGSASFYIRPNRRSHTKAIRFCSGSREFLEQLVCFLSQEVGVSNLNLRNEKENLWSCAYRSKSDMEAVIHYLYDDATIYIRRKKKICDLILDEIGKYRDN